MLENTEQKEPSLEEPLKSELDTSSQTLPTEEQQLPEQPQTIVMETHADHLHKIPGNGWKHYFFEFFMLFLAVTLGFFVENQREHYIEREREKEFIGSIYNDVTDDMSLLDYQTNLQKNAILQLDSFINIIGKGISAKDPTNSVYNFGRKASRSIYFTNNDKTIQQMKNSGGFRLIRSQESSNKIMDYYQLMDIIHMQMERVYLENEDYKRLAVKIFDPIVFNNMVVSEEIIAPQNNPSLISYDPFLLKEVAGSVQYMKGSRTTILSNIIKLKVKGKELLSFLQSEYSLK